MTITAGCVRWDWISWRIRPSVWASLKRIGGWARRSSVQMFAIQWKPIMEELGGGPDREIVEMHAPATTNFPKKQIAPVLGPHSSA